MTDSAQSVIVRGHANNLQSAISHSSGLSMRMGVWEMCVSSITMQISTSDILAYGLECNLVQQQCISESTGQAEKKPATLVTFSVSSQTPLLHINFRSQWFEVNHMSCNARFTLRNLMSGREVQNADPVVVHFLHRRKR